MNDGFFFENESFTSSLLLRSHFPPSKKACGAGECADIEKREALPNAPPFTSRQECRDSLLLTRLVALNHTRAAEETRGQIRWLRPEYQNKNAAALDPVQTNLPGTETPSSTSKINKQKSPIINPSSPWPAKLPAQVTLIRHLLTTDPTATPEQLSARFGRKNAKRQEQIEGIIETLRGLGQV